MQNNSRIRAAAAPPHAGITVLELFLVVAGIIVVMSLILGLISSKVNPKKDRDLRRMNDMAQLQKALSLYLDQTNQFPDYDGCLSGVDPVNQALRDRKVIEGSVSDPLWKSEKPQAVPEDKMTGCYYYTSSGSGYSIKFYLETVEYTGKSGQNIVRQ